MTAVSSTRLMAAAELEETPDDGNIYELVRGELITVTPSAYLPGVVVGRTIIALGAFVVPRRLGEVSSGDAVFWIERNPDTVRAPDV